MTSEIQLPSGTLIYQLQTRISNSPQPEDPSPKDTRKKKTYAAIFFLQRINAYNLVCRSRGCDKLFDKCESIRTRSSRLMAICICDSVNYAWGGTNILNKTKIFLEGRGGKIGIDFFT